MVSSELYGNQISRLSFLSCLWFTNWRQGQFICFPVRMCKQQRYSIDVTPKMKMVLLEERNNEERIQKEILGSLKLIYRSCDPIITTLYYEYYNDRLSLQSSSWINRWFDNLFVGRQGIKQKEASLKKFMMTWWYLLAVL